MFSQRPGDYCIIQVDVKLKLKLKTNLYSAIRSEDSVALYFTESGR